VQQFDDKPVKRPAPAPTSAPSELLAAVDLGSNSFRLLIGRVESGPWGAQIRPLDSLKESVRLAAGLGPDGVLDAEAQTRGAQALLRFGERLRSFSPSRVRAVGTNTLRIAHNTKDFLRTAEAALGFPIEVISGSEEARLIYLGAAHAMALDDQQRLVIDIGGGSTECIIGRNYEVLQLESIVLGCVSMSRQFFPSGEVDRRSFDAAVMRGRAAFAPIARSYRARGWRYAVGSSGTAKALTQAVQAHLGAESLTLEGLQEVAGALVKVGHVDRLRMEAIKPDRRPVLAGGLAVMIAVFEELGIEGMTYCNGALRQGVLYDLLGRSAGADMREITVAQMMGRYGVDPVHARLVADSAVALYLQAARSAKERIDSNAQMLQWAAQLCEIGMSIAHQDYHKHSAYIVQNAEMPGFALAEQSLLSRLVLGHTGGLRKLRSALVDQDEWLMVLALRIAVILHRRRDHEVPVSPALFFRRGKLRLEVAHAWASRHPLSDASLAQEVALWQEAQLLEAVDYFVL
jgi:exopolyphosphatase/guanosine-5'-triphosphate,3'-diphosphate pyrophosphatase